MNLLIMERNMKIQLPFWIRQGHNVALAVADYLGQPRKGALQKRPILMSVSGAKENLSPTFRFEGGLVVQVFLQDDNPEESDTYLSERYVVEKVITRYYKKPGDTDKEERTLTPYRLEEIQGSQKGWYNPHIVDYYL